MTKISTQKAWPATGPDGRRFEHAFSVDSFLAGDRGWQREKAGFRARLARKAGSLGDQTILPGWLYRTACFVSGSALKQELRRQQREQEAYMQSTLNEAGMDAAWKQMSPLLEEAMISKRSFILTTWSCCFVAFLFAAQFPVTAQDGFTDDFTVKAFLQEKFDGKNVGMVIGLVDERGGRIFSAGGMDNGTKQTVDGDTVFEIGSVTKTFTTLLLQDSAGRGEVKLEDSISDYLPKSVRCPTYGGKEITLLQLATHTSGLPEFPNNLSPGDGNRAYSGYTVEQLYDFLSGFTLTREPETQWEYSNVGVALLAHILVLKTGTDYESLVMERICRPLKMESTRITVTDEMKSRIARGHDSSGAPLPGQEFSVMSGASGLHSTAIDLLKYVSANLDLEHSSLTPLMKKTQAPRSSAPPKHNLTAMDWYDHGDGQPPGMKLLGHAGQTTGYTAFIGFDPDRRRGVVVLFNQQTGGGLGADSVGWLILEGARLTPQTVSVLFTGNSEELVGIGARLDFDSATRALKITKVFPNSPASQAGLLPELIVQKVDGVSTAGKSLAECLGLIRGKAGTKVRLELVNPKRNETNTVELTRQKFTPPKQ